MERKKRVIIFLLVFFIALPIMAMLINGITGNNSAKNSTNALNVSTGTSSAPATSHPAPVAVQQSVQETPFLFRDMPWGTSREDVIAKEGNVSRSTDIDYGELLIYQNVKVGGKSASLGITISSTAGMVGALYSFAINTDGYPYNTKLYIDAYSSLYGLLSEIYGNPRAGSQKAQSNGDDLMDYSEYYYRGGLGSTWELSGTKIYLKLSPEEPKGYDLAAWSLGLLYSSPQMQEISREDSRAGL
jgi:hypothetical protein